jgi:hypothetical protein
MGLRARLSREGAKVKPSLSRHPHRALPMGLAHCPLCVGLAVLSVVRCSACALMLWRWLRPQFLQPLSAGTGGPTPMGLRPAI